MKLIEAAILFCVSRGMKILQAGPAAELGRSPAQGCSPEVCPEYGRGRLCSRGLLAVMVICSRPVFASLRGATPRNWAILPLATRDRLGHRSGVVGWLTLGWFALEFGWQWFGFHRDCSLILMGAVRPLAVRHQRGRSVAEHGSSGNGPWNAS